MTVCRYYLQGKCRFGDRCRFEHVNNSSERNRGNDYSYQDRYRPQQYNDPNLSYAPRRDNYSERYNQSPKSNYSESYNQSPSYNYSERYDYNVQYSSERSQYNPRYYAPEEKDRFGSPSRYISDRNYYAQKYGQNKNEWMSAEYKKQLEEKSKKNQGVATFFNTSTPKSKVIFSFKDKDPGFSSTRNSIDLNMNEANLLVAEVIKQDVTDSELGGQWPFSCYFPITEKSGFPGFIDLSSEELRYEAYKAKEINAYNSYIESEKKAMLHIKNKRNELKEPSIKLISIIDRIRNGEDFSSEYVINCGDFFSRSNDSILEDMIAEEQPSLARNKASSFSFKTILDTDTIKKSASSFSFKDTGNSIQKNTSFSFKSPSVTDSKQPVSHAGSDIYTPLDKLSLQDKEQFLASTFTLGKIPTVPPPESMCF